MPIERGFQIDVNDSYKWVQWRRSRGGLNAFQIEYRDRVLADGGIVESIGCVKDVEYVYVLNLFERQYKARVIDDGGTIESIECLEGESYMDNNWDYYFRVERDGGLVESLECAK